VEEGSHKAPAWEDAMNSLKNKKEETVLVWPKKGRAGSVVAPPLPEPKKKNRRRKRVLDVKQDPSGESVGVKTDQKSERPEGGIIPKRSGKNEHN